MTRTYRLTDECGNTADITQTITILDNVAPTADPLPALGPYACYANIPAANIADVTGEADNCAGAVTVTHVSDSPDPGCTGTVTRTYRLTDECGNTADITQTITILDNVAPTADPLPALGPYACYANIPAANIADVTGEADNCAGAVTVTHVSDSPDPGCTGTVTRTYRLTDECGNTADITQTITILDNVAPTADPLPALGPYACYANIPAANIADVTGEADNCAGAVTVTHVSDSPDPGCTGTVTRTYRLTDECGNTADITQTITILDNVAPTADPLPALGPYACYANIPAANIADVTGEADNCAGAVTVTHVSDSPDPGCTGTVTRTYRLTDECGNTADITQTITILDNVAPTADPLPALGPYACYANIPAANIADVTGEADNCAGAVTVTHVSDSPDPGCTGTVTRTYRLTDECGNTADITQTITILDNVAPTADPLPALGPYACYANIPAANIADVTGEADNCAGAVTVTHVSDSPDPGCTGTVTRTYRLTDECGNTADITQTITILDNVAPTADPLPALGPYACYANIPAANIADVTGEADNCAGAVTVTHVSDSPDPGCTGTVTRTYRLTDECGNTADITQTITILDNVAPTADPLPALGPYACYANIPAANIADVTGEADNCAGAVTVTHVSDSPDPGCTGTVTRTYRLTDECGNTADITQTITILDNVAPTADPLPALGPYACYANIPAANIADVTGEADNCAGAVTVTHVSDSPDPGCTGTVTRTYRLTDECGNTADITQTITILDNVAPTADPLPALGPYACYANIPAANIADVTGEADNCAGAVTVTHVSDSPDPGCTGTVTRTYRLTDECGNTADITQTITILDNVLRRLTHYQLSVLMLATPIFQLLTSPM